MTEKGREPGVRDFSVDFAFFTQNGGIEHFSCHFWKSVTVVIPH